MIQVKLDITVRDLIEHLKKLEQDATICVINNSEWTHRGLPPIKCKTNKDGKEYAYCIDARW